MMFFGEQKLLRLSNRSLKLVTMNTLRALVTDAEVHEHILERVLTDFALHGLAVRGLTYSADKRSCR